MTTRYLQQSQLGLYFTLGTLFREDGEFDDCTYFAQRVPAVRQALQALPIWRQTVEELNDPMQIAPYVLCEFDSEFEVIDGKLAYSFWIENERVAVFSDEHAAQMRDAIASALVATCVKVEAYQEWKESIRIPMALPA